MHNGALRRGTLPARAPGFRTRSARPGRAGVLRLNGTSRWDAAFVVQGATYSIFLRQDGKCQKWSRDFLHGPAALKASKARTINASGVAPRLTTK